MIEFLKFITEPYDRYIKPHWSDPVWSKVISNLIIVISGFILTGIYVGVKSIFENVPFFQILEQIYVYFKSKIYVNAAFLWIALVISLWTILRNGTSFFIAVFKKTQSLSHKKEISDELPTIKLHSTAFFSSRLAEAFPGQRGLEWYDARETIRRLNVMLKSPLKFKGSGFDFMGDPIWWFRGGGALPIDEYSSLSKTKILLGYDELQIKRMAVYVDRSYYKSFIYLEALPEKQTGLYNYSPEDIKRHIDTFGYSSEEYGMLGRKAISREQFDDGGSVINGKIVDASNAKLRVRYLSNYNILIAAKQSPYNSLKFNRGSQILMDGILSNNLEPSAFFEFLSEFEKNEGRNM